MTTVKQIEKERQLLARCEKSLTIEKMKKRKADTRHKIELGGLVIKSELAKYEKCIILGAMKHAVTLINKDPQHYISIFKIIGESNFNYDNVRR
ncbi:TPA: conjugal transfer protein TraD [Legionella pneumophila subsp. pneumophila]|nr:conjugal transfer protein TraD [Legionella pneumophila]MDW8922588.1 conjugal transfer protein TraD [Legionella pneumophila]MDW8928727.1 conjugal transfer protein TraD [Legionella pneumophila]MDX1866555.1 conjugal transfer protein TraD [Legionella pneumophila]HAT9621495.1 conjugal transfer protein TraD [Legionella pneumophila subsp. pneumophila]